MKVLRILAMASLAALLGCQPKPGADSRPIPHEKLGGYFAYDLPSAMEIPGGISIAEGHILGGGKDKLDMYLIRGTPQEIAQFFGAILAAAPAAKKFAVKDGKTFLGLADPAKMASAGAPAWWSPWTMKDAVMENITDRRRGVWVCYSAEADYAYVFCWSA